MSFVEACSVQEIPPGKSRPAFVDGICVALFNVAGSIHAIENSCLHSGASLCNGKLEGNIVTCPAHGWRYDVTTGALVVAPEKRIRAFPVQLVGEKILVQVEA